VILQKTINGVSRSFGRLKQSQYVGAVTTLALGTLMAQVIVVGASPILTRVYAPEDFGIFALFMALVSSLVPIVCGKYEVAMMLPKSDRQGLQLLGISVRTAFLVSSILLFVIVSASYFDLVDLFPSELGDWLYLLPIMLFGMGIHISLNYYSNRQRMYKEMANAKLLQAVVVTTVTITLGFFGAGFNGFVIGSLLGLILAIIYLTALNQSKLLFSSIKWNKNMWELLVQYKSFPMFNASSGLLDGLTLAMPIYFLSLYFPPSVVGYYALVVRVGSAPLAFLSGSISQVNLRKVVDLVASGQDVQSYLLYITAGLVGITALPTFILMFYSQSLFAFVFGEEWRVAGEFMEILAPSLAVSFVVSTLSSTLGATNNNFRGMVWKVVAFATTLLFFALLAPQGDIRLLLQAVVFMNVALYLFYYWQIWQAAGEPKN
jgi:O-antigen/teichoic acid export membrane protein